MSELAFFWLLLIAMPVTIGYSIPPRAVPWTIISAIGVIVLAMLTIKWSLHNPGPLLVAAAGLSFILGNAIRLAHAQVADRRARQRGGRS